jgi:hypothetical protein
MGLFKDLFGASQAEVWKNVAREVGGTFNGGALFEKTMVRLNYGRWEIVLDSYAVTHSTGKYGNSTTHYTRMRAPFINKDGFYFKIYNSSLFSPIGKFFGMQDIEVGDPIFDENFIIKGNDTLKINKMFKCEILKGMIAAQPKISFAIKDDEGLFGTRFPKGVDELYFEVPYIITDVEQLKELFDIFALTLELLVELDTVEFRRTGIHL